MLVTLLAFAVTLGVLIFVHEFGHFAAAKWAGIWVHRFSIGIGTPIPGLTVKKGETEYSLSWLPLGGYVKMASLEEEASSAALEGGTPEAAVPPDRMFEAKPVWKRMIVILAGVTMNTLFAWLIFSGLALKNGKAVNPLTVIGVVDSAGLPQGAESFRTLQAGDRITAINGRPMDSWNSVFDELQHTSGNAVTLTLADGRAVTAEVPADAVERRMALAGSLAPFTPAIAGRVVPGRPAAKAGMQQGDTVVSVNGQPITQWPDLLTVIEGSAGQELRVGIGRTSGRTEVAMVPESTTVNDSSGPRVVGKIGVEVNRGFSRVPYTVLGAMGAGVTETVNASTVILRVLKGLFSGNVARSSLGGPIAIGPMAGQSARMGVEPFLTFMAIISMNLAVLNLLPIPVLDGGQFMFLLGEAVRRKPLPIKLRERLTLVGLAIVGALIVFATWNDLSRLARQFLSS
jgi:regulator of sigma E protease